jgi:undecaprenyl-phosphate 4-deoxy-4-formamido-L-arabinose transferase
MISIVIPVYNAEHSIAKLVKNIIEVFSNLEIEVILVNDNSPDNSHEECLRVFEENKSIINYVKLSKNVGEHNAIMAGLRYVEGDWALIMDDDFQNPPKEGLKLINFALENNYDIVYGDYEIKRHNIFRNLISKINDITANYLLKKPKGLYLSSFKCIKKKLLKNIILYKGPFPYIDGLVLSLTGNIGSLKTEHAARISGKSGYSLSKLLKLYGNLAINFSTTPIHIFSLAGFIIAGVSGLYGIFIFLEKFLNPTTPIGYSSLLTTIVFFSGIQLIFLGLIGEYVGKILKNVNQEKQYNIDFEKLKNGKK